MADEWFYAREGQQFGPVNPAQLKQLASTGQLAGTDLVWKPGMAQWLPATQVKGLLGGSADQRAVPVAPRSTGNDPTVPASGNVQAPPEPTTHAPFDGVGGAAPAGPMSGEPWFYGFIEGYIKLFLLLGIVGASLGLLLYLGSALVGMAQAGWSAATNVLGIIAMLAGLVIFAVWILGLLFTAALFLLAVDAARSLRTLRKDGGD